MFLLGTLVNMLCVLLGSVLGIIIGDKIKDRFKKIVMQVLGLSVFIIGVGYALKPKNTMVVIVSLVIGSIIGEAIDIDKHLNRFGSFVEAKFSKGEGFAKGFITATLLFCVGAMAITGSLNSGLKNDHNILYVKSVLDGITSIMFAASLGIGVMFSIIPIFLYQGGIAFFAQAISPYLVGDVKFDMFAAGGILIMALGLDMLEIKKFKVANMLPAIIIPVIYYDAILKIVECLRNLINI
jgi:uncharacterized membrane protein YqgA involved in biofilm formation